MRKAVSVVAGVVIFLGLVATAGAWYTGSQVEGAVREAVVQANQQLRQRLVGQWGPARLEMVSMERHLFNTQVHYRLRLEGQAYRSGGEPMELLFVDQVDHGPLPISRLRQLKLWPVMIANHVQLVRNTASEPWFAASQGVSPVHVRLTVGYDQSLNADVQLLPFVGHDVKGPVRFSGAGLQIAASADARQLDSKGRLDDLQLTVPSQAGPLTLQLSGLAVESVGALGASGLYLGDSKVGFDRLTMQVAGNPLLELKDFSNGNRLGEANGTLSGQAAYTLGMIRYGEHDIGSLQMAFKASQMNAVATQALVKFYQDVVVAKLQPVAGQASAPGQLSAAEEAELARHLDAWLVSRPHLELEQLVFKTAEGTSRASLALELAKGAGPGPGSYPVSELKAHVQLSKPMLSGLMLLRAQSSGMAAAQESVAAIRSGVDGFATLAQVMGFATVEGDDMVSRLHYRDGKVDFNGREMTVQQWLQLMGSLAPTYRR
jgi:uncharacterized protein YdgA (DUF945 family)